MGLSVAVIGAAGYAGGELLRLLSQHPEVNDYIATSRSQAGMRIGEVHPALAAVSDARSPTRVPSTLHQGGMSCFWPWSTANLPKSPRRS